LVFILVLFFFRAEDGIRDFHVTGVQTCALPISLGPGAESESPSAAQGPAPVDRPGDGDTARPSAAAVLETPSERSVAGPGAEGDAPDEAGAALAADAPERVGSDTQQAVASVAAATHRPGP